MIFEWNSTVATIAAGTGLLGALAGSLGAFAVVRRQSLLADAVSHATLPGVVIAYLLTHDKHPLTLALGATAAGWLGALTVLIVVRRTRLPFDGALALCLSTFFGLGLLLLTSIQKRADAGQAGLDKFLFGQAATMLVEDVWTILCLGCAAIAVVLLFWKELKLMAFDAGFAQGMGLPVNLLDAGLMFVLVLAVVIGLQAVGVVLMSALIVAPSVAARPWCRTLGSTMLLAGLIGGLSGVVGSQLSFYLSRTARTPTGPMIVLVATAFVALSLAPSLIGRGMRWLWRRSN